MDTNNNDIAQEINVIMTSFTRDLLEKMNHGFKKLETAIDKQSTRIDQLERSLAVKLLHENYSLSACISYGGHRHAKQRRDYYFRLFMDKMMTLWTLQRNVRKAHDQDDSGETENEITTLKEDAALYLKIIQSEEGRFKLEYENYVLKDQDCVMYRKLWFPREMPCSEILNFQSVSVSMGGGEIKSFKKANVQYIDENFDQTGVFRVPPFTFYTDKITTSKKHKTKNDLTLHTDEELWELVQSGVLRKKQYENLLVERNADTAVENVVKALEMWAEKTSQNMFIFSNYKYGDYLKNVKGVNATDIRGDHDIMAISESYGVIFIQVKSSEPSENERNLQDKARQAFYQTLKDKFVFLQSNRDLPYVTLALPIYGFVALPNLYNHHLDKHFLCTHHKSIVLSGSHLKTQATFSEWISNAFLASPTIASGTTNAFTHAQFRELSGRYVGLASAVSVPTIKDAIHKSGKKLGLHLLTPMQRRVRDSCRKCMIISGDTGTGKSLILAWKARNIIREAEKENEECIVNLVTCTDINDSLFCALTMSYRSSQQLEKFMGNQKELNRVNIFQFRDLHEEALGKNFKVTPELLTETIHKLTETIDGTRQHVLMDEVPFEVLKQAKDMLDGSIEKIPEGSHVWLTVSTHTYRVDSRTMTDPSWIKDHIPATFHFEYLDLIKRVPRSLFKVIKEIQSITGDGHNQFSKCGHVIEGPKPLLYRLRTCKCSTDPNTDYMRCSCAVKRVKETFQRLFKDLGASKDGNDITLVVHNFAIHGTTFSDLRYLLDTTFDAMGFKLIWSTVLFKSSTETEEALSGAVKKTDTFRKGEGSSLGDQHKRQELSSPVNSSSGYDERKTLRGVQQNNTSEQSIRTESVADQMLTNKLDMNNLEHQDIGVLENIFSTYDESGKKKLSRSTDDEFGGGLVVKDRKPKPSITVVDTRTFIGCEGKILISFDQCGMFHHFAGKRGVGWHRISLCRCVAQYVYVTWPEEEAAQNWRKYIREYEEDVFVRTNLTKEQLKFRKDQIKQGRDASHQTSCLQKLLAKGLFVEK